MNARELQAILALSTPAVRAALGVLYTAQSADEQARGETKHRNGAGFNATDAAFGTSLAQQVTAGRPLSAKQFAAARRMLPKYVRQLLVSGTDWAQWSGGELEAAEAFAAELAGGETP